MQSSIIEFKLRVNSTRYDEHNTNLGNSMAGGCTHANVHITNLCKQSNNPTSWVHRNYISNKLTNKLNNAYIVSDTANWSTLDYGFRLWLNLYDPGIREG